ncbi:MAG: M48 family metalloprotease [Chloroflexi bacterium]|nr:M48 family metalloprotease [Chloroflexota bacterium]
MSGETIDDEAPTPNPWAVRANPAMGAGEAVRVDRAAREQAEHLGSPTHDASQAHTSRAHRDGGWASIAGPVDRVSFFAEQARRRRQTWRLSILGVVAVILAGLPLCLVVTPLVYLAIVLLTKAMSYAIPLSPEVPRFYRTVAGSIGAIMVVVEEERWPPAPEHILPLIAGILAILLPGIVTMLAIWILLRRAFARAGVGGILLGLGAREPRLTDLEERQLVNVVEEMAVAAGLPAPRVMLLDGVVANAAAVGSGPDDAVVVVSRRMLDEMDRDETQGVLGHLIASIGNGDLGIALMMVTIFRTFGLVYTILDAPISASARATLGRLILFLLGRHGSSEQEQAEATARLLSNRTTDVDMSDVDAVLGSDAEKQRMPGGVRGLLMKIRVYGLFPIWAAGGMARTAMSLLILGVLSPLLAWTWRTRRYLADATAVQLTRNPDGIARGLSELLMRGGGIPGGEWASHLFVVGGGLAARREDAELAARLRQEMTGGGSLVERLAAAGAIADAERERRGGKSADQASGRSTQSADSELSTFGWIDPHPPLEKRLERLRALGAHVADPVNQQSMSSSQKALMAVVLGPLGLLIAVLMSIAVVLATGLAVVFMMIPMALVYAVFELLF